MRVQHRLTALAVSRASHPGRYPDGGGLYLQISGSGSKAWIFRFMLSGRARHMGLGPLADVSLTDARNAAQEARRKLRQGQDPIEARLAELDARRAQEAERLTFKEAATRYITVHEPTWRNTKHRQQWRNTLAAYAYPKLGARPVSAITEALINEAIEPIHRTKAETASRVKQRVGRVIEWAKAGFPAPIESASRRVKHHPSLPYVALPAFMADLRQRMSTSARALEFTILTIARTGAVIGATWDEIDSTAKVWTVRPDRDGTKITNGKPHRVPLSARALEILAALPREKDNPHVFIGGKEGESLSNAAMSEMLKNFDLPSDRPDRQPVVHGFRATFKTWAGETTAYPRELVEAAQAHAIKNKTEAAYERGDKLERRRRLMTDWARYCAQPRQRAAKVVPIGRARKIIDAVG